MIGVVAAAEIAVGLVKGCALDSPVHTFPPRTMMPASMAAKADNESGGVHADAHGGHCRNYRNDDPDVCQQRGVIPAGAVLASLELSETE